MPLLGLLWAALVNTYSYGSSPNQNTGVRALGPTFNPPPIEI